MQMIRMKIYKITLKVFKRDNSVNDALMTPSNNAKVSSIQKIDIKQQQYGEERNSFQGIMVNIVVNACIINVVQFLTMFIMNMNQQLSIAKVLSIKK